MFAATAACERDEIPMRICVVKSATVVTQLD